MSNRWFTIAARWYYVLRYYRKRQLGMRLVGLVRRRLRRVTGGRGCAGLADEVPVLRPNAGLEHWGANCLERWNPDRAAEVAERLQAGRFRFLNEERSLPDPIDWHLADSPEVAHLWRFCLHYHEYLVGLAAHGLRTGQAAALQRAWDIVRQWIDADPPEEPRAPCDAWHPYCISRRLPAWMVLWAASPPQGPLADRVLQSFAAQAAFLERNLEWDLGGNHLLENLRALLLAGTFLDGPAASRWLQRARALLPRELAEQILPHGEHFERSPMYHAQMLDALLDIRDATGALDAGLPAICQDYALRMGRFLDSILHPDGGIPLLGDSEVRGQESGVRGQESGVRGQGAGVRSQGAGVRSQGAEVSGEGAGSRSQRSEVRGQEEGDEQGGGSGEQRAAGGNSSICRLSDSSTFRLFDFSTSRVFGDYWVFRDGGDFLIFDAGPVGADHLPAHAHADLLGFEASVGRRRLFVDAGVFDYEDSEMRRYCRSSAAHNVLVIDGQDQCDMWSRFRMGYRGWPRGLAAGEQDGFHWARAEHNAYRRLRVPTVGRWISCRPSGPWLSVDWATGRGRHRLTNYLHVHPDVAVELADAENVRLTVAGAAYRLKFLVPGDVALAEGWYCPEFGLRLPATVIRWETTTILPALSAWMLCPAGLQGEASLDARDTDNPRLAWQENGQETVLRPRGQSGRAGVME